MDNFIKWCTIAIYHHQNCLDCLNGVEINDGNVNNQKRHFIKFLGCVKKLENYGFKYTHWFRRN